MISKLGQVMIYVSNQNKAAEFWREAVGFTVVSEEDNGQMRWIEIAPSAESETSIILHNKEIIASMQPDMNLGTPSLMFYTDHLDELYSRLVNNGVKVGEIVEMPSGRVFNFADWEENYFAVMEKNK